MINDPIKASGVAWAAHQGQTYGDQSYYNGHLVPVARTARALAEAWANSTLTDTTPLDPDEVETVAWLHDIIEDAGVIAQDLVEYGLDEHVVDAIMLLTRPLGKTYGAYILRIAEGSSKAYRLAQIVKIADLMVNITAPGKPELAKRYYHALQVLA